MTLHALAQQTHQHYQHAFLKQLLSFNNLNSSYLIHISDYFDQKSSIDCLYLNQLEHLIDELRNNIHKSSNTTDYSNDKNLDMSLNHDDINNMDLHSIETDTSTVKSIIDQYLTNEFLSLQSLKEDIKKQSFYSDDLRNKHRALIGAHNTFTDTLPYPPSIEQFFHQTHHDAHLSAHNNTVLTGINDLDKVQPGMFYGDQPPTDISVLSTAERQKNINIPQQWVENGLKIPNVSLNQDTGSIHTTTTTRTTRFVVNNSSYKPRHDLSSTIIGGIQKQSSVYQHAPYTTHQLALNSINPTFDNPSEINQSIPTKPIYNKSTIPMPSITSKLPLHNPSTPNPQLHHVSAGTSGLTDSMKHGFYSVRVDSPKLDPNKLGTKEKQSKTANQRRFHLISPEIASSAPNNDHNSPNSPIFVVSTNNHGRNRNVPLDIPNAVSPNTPSLDATACSSLADSASRGDKRPNLSLLEPDPKVRELYQVHYATPIFATRKKPIILNDNEKPEQHTKIFPKSQNNLKKTNFIPYIDSFSSSDAIQPRQQPLKLQSENLEATIPFELVRFPSPHQGEEVVSSPSSEKISVIVTNLPPTPPNLTKTTLNPSTVPPISLFPKPTPSTPSIQPLHPISLELGAQLAPLTPTQLDLNNCIGFDQFHLKSVATPPINPSSPPQHNIVHLTNTDPGNDVEQLASFSFDPPPFPAPIKPVHPLNNISVIAGDLSSSYAPQRITKLQHPTPNAQHYEIIKIDVPPVVTIIPTPIFTAKPMLYNNYQRIGVGGGNNKPVVFIEHLNIPPSNHSTSGSSVHSMVNNNRPIPLTTPVLTHISGGVTDELDTPTHLDAAAHTFSSAGSAPGISQQQQFPCVAPDSTQPLQIVYEVVDSGSIHPRNIYSSTLSQTQFGHTCNNQKEISENNGHSQGSDYNNTNIVNYYPPHNVVAVGGMSSSKQQLIPLVISHNSGNGSLKNNNIENTHFMVNLNQNYPSRNHRSLSDASTSTTHTITTTTTTTITMHKAHNNTNSSNSNHNASHDRSNITNNSNILTSYGNQSTSIVGITTPPPQQPQNHVRHPSDYGVITVTLKPANRSNEESSTADRSVRDKTSEEKPSESSDATNSHHNPPNSVKTNKSSGIEPPAAIFSRNIALNNSSTVLYAMMATPSTTPIQTLAPPLSTTLPTRRSTHSYFNVHLSAQPLSSSQSQRNLLKLNPSQLPAHPTTPKNQFNYAVSARSPFSERKTRRTPLIAPELALTQNSENPPLFDDDDDSEVDGDEDGEVDESPHFDQPPDLYLDPSAKVPSQVCHIITTPVPAPSSPQSSTLSSDANLFLLPCPHSIKIHTESNENSSSGVIINSLAQTVIPPISTAIELPVAPTEAVLPSTPPPVQQGNSVKKTVRSYHTVNLSTFQQPSLNNENISPSKQLLPPPICGESQISSNMNSSQKNAIEAPARPYHPRTASSTSPPQHRLNKVQVLAQLFDKPSAPTTTQMTQKFAQKPSLAGFSRVSGAQINSIQDTHRNGCVKSRDSPIEINHASSVITSVPKILQQKKTPFIRENYQTMSTSDHHQSDIATHSSSNLTDLSHNPNHSRSSFVANPVISPQIANNPPSYIAPRKPRRLPSPQSKPDQSRKNPFFALLPTITPTGRPSIAHSDQPRPMFSVDNLNGIGPQASSIDPNSSFSQRLAYWGSHTSHTKVGTNTSSHDASHLPTSSRNTHNNPHVGTTTPSTSPTFISLPSPNNESHHRASFSPSPVLPKMKPSPSQVQKDAINGPSSTKPLWVVATAGISSALRNGNINDQGSPTIVIEKEDDLASVKHYHQHQPQREVTPATAISMVSAKIIEIDPSSPNHDMLDVSQQHLIQFPVFPHVFNIIPSPPQQVNNRGKMQDAIEECIENNQRMNDNDTQHVNNDNCSDCSDADRVIMNTPYIMELDSTMDNASIHRLGSAIAAMLNRTGAASCANGDSLSFMIHDHENVLFSTVNDNISLYNSGKMFLLQPSVSTGTYSNITTTTTMSSQTNLAYDHPYNTRNLVNNVNDSQNTDVAISMVSSECSSVPIDNGEQTPMSSMLSLCKNTSSQNSLKLETEPMKHNSYCNDVPTTPSLHNNYYNSNNTNNLSGKIQSNLHQNIDSHEGENTSLFTTHAKYKLPYIHVSSYDDDHEDNDVTNDTFDMFAHHTNLNTPGYLSHFESSVRSQHNASHTQVHPKQTPYKFEADTVNGVSGNYCQIDASISPARTVPNTLRQISSMIRCGNGEPRTPRGDHNHQQSRIRPTSSLPQQSASRKL